MPPVYAVVAAALVWIGVGATTAAILAPIIVGVVLSAGMSLAAQALMGRKQKSLTDGGQTLTVALWSRNLFNEEHIYRRSNANRVPIDGNYRTVVGDYANFNAPRTFGIEAILSF